MAVQVGPGPDNSPESASKTDIFFHKVYGKPHDAHQPPSFMDTILGNIGEPLRVDDEDEEEEIIRRNTGEEEMASSEIFQANSGGEYSHHEDV